MILRVIPYCNGLADIVRIGDVTREKLVTLVGYSVNGIAVIKSV